MAPPRRNVTALGEAIRAARTELSLRQDELGRRVHVSTRQLSRWENGVASPDTHEAERLVRVLRPLSPPAARRLRESLGIPYDDAAPEPEALSPATSHAQYGAVPVAAPEEARAAFETLLYATAEESDLLPRHLRAFGISLLETAARLGLASEQAAALLVRKGPTKATPQG